MPSISRWDLIRRLKFKDLFHWLDLCTDFVSYAYRCKTLNTYGSWEIDSNTMFE